MKKLLLLVTAIAFISNGCDKDQQVVRQLNGTWKVTEMKVNGQAEDPKEFEGTEYSFEKCRLKKDGECEGGLTIMKIGAPEGSSFTYVISDDGKKITITSASAIGDDVETGDILDHSKKEFRFTLNDDRGNSREIALEKIEP